MPKSKRNLKTAKAEIIEATRKFKQKKLYINKDEDDHHTISSTKTKDSIHCYRNGSEISL